MTGPSPDTRYPIPGITRSGFLRNFITRPTITVGDYTYYDDPRGPERFEENVLYHFDFIGDWLVIGKFCSIAAETRLIMNGGQPPDDLGDDVSVPRVRPGLGSRDARGVADEGRHRRGERRVDRLWQH